VNLVQPGLSSQEGRAVFGFDSDDLNIGLSLFEKCTNSLKRPSASYTCDEDVYLPA